MYIFYYFDEFYQNYKIAYNLDACKIIDIRDFGIFNWKMKKIYDRLCVNFLSFYPVNIFWKIGKKNYNENLSLLQIIQNNLNILS